MSRLLKNDEEWKSGMAFVMADFYTILPAGETCNVGERPQFTIGVDENYVELVIGCAMVNGRENKIETE